MTYYACTIRYNLHELLIWDVVFIKALHNETRYLSNIQVCPELKLVTLQKQKKNVFYCFWLIIYRKMTFRNISHICTQ